MVVQFDTKLGLTAKPECLFCMTAVVMGRCSASSQAGVLGMSCRGMFNVNLMHSVAVISWGSNVQVTLLSVWLLAIMN